MVKLLKIILDEPCYYPGATVKGSVVVSANTPKEFAKITITIFGFARARWTESTGYKEQTTFQNTLRYIEQGCVLWSRERSPTGNLPAGEHSFPFGVKLPYQVPPSFKSFTGKIVYQMEAKITQTSMFKFNRKAKVTLDVRSYIPRLCMQPKNDELDSSLTFCCCFNFGQVTVNCSIPRSGYVVAEAIPITIDINNQSNKNIYIHASISKLAVYNSGRGQTRMSSKDNLAVSRSQSVSPGSTAVLENVINIPRKLPVSITSCPVMSVNYFLVIQARSIIGSSEKMKIPIVIAHARTPPVDQRLVDQVVDRVLGILRQHVQSNHL